MSERRTGCSPASHPHADQPNWRPATTFEDYIVNCREGLEKYSERRVAALLGWSRVQLWRAALIASLPEELFERLVSSRPVPSTKSMAHIAQALANGRFGVDIERCRHCGGLLRKRQHVGDVHAAIVLDWLDEAERKAAE